MLRDAFFLDFLFKYLFWCRDFQATLSSEKLWYLQKEFIEEKATFPVSRNTGFAFTEFEVKRGLSFVPCGAAYSETKLII